MLFEERRGDDHVGGREAALGPARPLVEPHRRAGFLDESRAPGFGGPGAVDLAALEHREDVGRLHRHDGHACRLRRRSSGRRCARGSAARCPACRRAAAWRCACRPGRLASLMPASGRTTNSAPPLEAPAITRRAAPRLFTKPLRAGLGPTYAMSTSPASSASISCGPALNALTSQPAGARAPCAGCHRRRQPAPPHASGSGNAPRVTVPPGRRRAGDELRTRWRPAGRDPEAGAGSTTFLVTWPTSTWATSGDRAGAVRTCAAQKHESPEGVLPGLWVEPGEWRVSEDRPGGGRDQGRKLWAGSTTTGAHTTPPAGARHGCRRPLHAAMLRRVRRRVSRSAGGI